MYPLMRLLQVRTFQEVLKFLILIFLILIVVSTFINLQTSTVWKDLCINQPLWTQNIDFDTVNIANDTGTVSGCYIVPNFIHFVRFGDKDMTYTEMIVVLAVLKNQKPDKIFIHRNRNGIPTGKYWDILLGFKPFTDVVEFKHVEEPEEIFGQRIARKYRKFHSSDVTRIRVLMKYGGIYLDSDTYVINSLDDFRRFELTLNWDEGQFLASQLVLAHKDARFLKLWLESYRGAYKANRWYYNAGERPTTEILWKRPELIHRVKVKFGADTKFIWHILQTQWSKWRTHYALHLLIHHQYLCKNLTKTATFPVEFDEHNIGNYPITFREMAYDVYEFANLPWPTGQKD